MAKLTATTINLFGEAFAPLAPKERKMMRAGERRRKAKLCYQSTSEAWKKAVYEFAANVFLAENDAFIFEHLSTAYEIAAKANGWPQTVEKRAFAGVRARLIREKLIEPMRGEFNYRSQGSMSQTYRSLINGK